MFSRIVFHQRAEDIDVKSCFERKRAARDHGSGLVVESVGVWRGFGYQFSGSGFVAIAERGRVFEVLDIGF